MAACGFSALPGSLQAPLLRHCIARLTVFDAPLEYLVPHRIPCL